MIVPEFEGSLKVTVRFWFVVSTQSSSIARTLNETEEEPAGKVTVAGPLKSALVVVIFEYARLKVTSTGISPVAVIVKVILSPSLAEASLMLHSGEKVSVTVPISCLEKISHEA